MGRRSRYRKESHPARARDLASKGWSNKEIAHEFGIHEDTLYEWLKKYPEFSESIELGKDKPNTEVKAALFKRAVGYPFTETYLVPTEEGKPPRIERIVRKEMAPDIQAIRLFLMNRLPEEFRERMEITLPPPEDAGVNDAVFDAMVLRIMPQAKKPKDDDSGKAKKGRAAAKPRSSKRLPVSKAPGVLAGDKGSPDSQEHPL